MLKHKNALLIHGGIAETSAAEVHAQFERHIHSREFTYVSCLAAAEVVNAEFRTTNELHDPFEARLGII